MLEALGTLVVGAVLVWALLFGLPGWWARRHGKCEMCLGTSYISWPAAPCVGCEEGVRLWGIRRAVSEEQWLRDEAACRELGHRWVRGRRIQVCTRCAEWRNT